MMKRLLITAAAALISLSAAAKLTVKEPCSNGMVLQQNTSAVIWGHASAGSQIAVSTPWDRKTVKVTTDEKGTWRAYVNTPAASFTPWTIKIKGDGDKMLIENVLIGEVWVASGQSNMEMPLNGFGGCPVEGSNEAIMTSGQYFNKLRMYTVKVHESEEILDDVAEGTGWLDASPNTSRWMSATAFFFGRALQQALGVPVGILSLPRGGARVESWMPKSMLEKYGDEDLSHDAAWSREWGKAYAMYHGMQHPVQGYTAKGFIWYQGCSNVGAHEQFVSRMSDMVELWRSDWNDSECKMPFYQVEIMPFLYGDPSQNGVACYLRAAQLEISHVIPNSAIVITDDLAKPYEYDNIHPCAKEPVGRRLAQLALNRDYGFTGINIDYPEVSGAKIVDGRLLVQIRGAWNGFDRNHLIEGLEIIDAAGNSHKISDINYDWKGNMLIDVNEITDPCEVRYCWGDFVPGNLHNTDGNPVAPFCCRIEN